jgi:hypothetical protein
MIALPQEVRRHYTDGTRRENVTGAPQQLSGGAQLFTRCTVAVAVAVTVTVERNPP